MIIVYRMTVKTKILLCTFLKHSLVQALNIIHAIVRTYKIINYMYSLVSHVMKILVDKLPGQKFKLNCYGLYS